MKLLAIESSADETGVAILEVTGDPTDAHFRVLGEALFSQSKIHEAYGGIYPTMAKRNHAQNLTPLLQATLQDADLFRQASRTLSEEELTRIDRILRREPDLATRLIELLRRIERPQVDAIAVTVGPGLEPALWVGVNAARVLSLLWQLPLIETNHIEGHLVSALTSPDEEGVFHLRDVAFPVTALIISGGHTDLIHLEDWGAYRYLGSTRDDALGEAYDKVARMLDLPYPGGVHIERLAAEARKQGLEAPFDLPRPMLKSGDLDFSFSGLKTATMYALKDWKREHGDELTEDDKRLFALEFENAIFDVVVLKVDQALREYGGRTLVVSGGVSASSKLRTVIRKLLEHHHPDVQLALPEPQLSTDNAVMIGMAGALRVEHALTPTGELSEVRANGNLRLG
ncbi:tRNA (adenosine(37)-N6)-threonylcarbamoyltransferase complex transferase subunit TsaD [Patescibacteria group bacterium]|jgi:N6-L-threonylcarbamoyladenine synthase|nr:tRNA (adenosine(37)-N6)-threonylcarbamoyltransferase complex transferase subunit TsaD [Patescibacteria group bacterium]